ncbi:MAG: DUF7379 domain-containing protein [Acidimicrobiales bacterium]
MAELRGDGTPVVVSGARVSSEGARGTVVPATSLRQPTSGVLLGALADLGMRVDRVFGVDAEPVADQQRGRTRSATGATGVLADVMVEVPPPPQGQAQVLLVDEGGAISWILPERPASGTRSRATTVTQFRIPVALPPDDEQAGQRGVVGKLIRKVVQVLTFDLIDKVAGEVGDFFVRRWEAERRPHRLRSFAAGSYCDPKVAALDEDAIRALGAGPALLLLHGTNSLTHSGFAALPDAAVAALNTTYGGRVFAFDHPTLSLDPMENAKELAARLPAGLSLDVDVLAHSRGGLVARVLAEQAESAGTAGKIRVRQVVFVATPNLGTPLADPENLGKLLDGLTNLLDIVPDNPVTDSLAGIVSVVRQLAVGALGGLDGLMAQNQRLADNPFLTALNTARPHDTRYRALAADYEPAPNTGRGRWARDAALDAIFGWEANDLIVPTAGTYAWNGASNFPITERIVLPPERAVDHSTFWTAPEALDAFTAWLKPDSSALKVRASIAPVSVVRGASTDPLSEVDERFAAGDLDGVREAVRALPSSELDRLQSQVGELALDSFATRGTPGPKQGVVFVLPGIMGSNLWAHEGRDTDRIWLHPPRLVWGGFRRLQVSDGAGDIKAGGLYRSYLPLVIGLDAAWEVIPAGYDWRRPLEEAADSLAQRIADRSGGGAMPAHLVCHSMGGLVARMLIARHPSAWRDIDNPTDRSKGGRLVMLGTPTLGSFAIALALSGDDHLVKWLAKIDVRNDLNQIVEVLGTFPGAYQLLTAFDAPIADSQHQALYDVATWGSNAIVADHLKGARDTHELLARSGFDAARMFYVAGSGHRTPAAVDVDPERPGLFRYQMTDAGDGRVSHALGIPLDGNGVPVFGEDHVRYSTAEHGDLTKNRDVIAAVDDILRRGPTKLLAAKPPASRGVVTDAHEWIPAEMVEPPIDDLPLAVAGSRGRSASRTQQRAAAQAAADRAVEGWLGSTVDEGALPVLRVSVLHASLEYCTFPIMVGHYQGDPIAGAEGYLDGKLDGALTSRQVAGRYPEEVGEVYRVPTAGKPPGALIVGLGPRGDMTPSGLTSAVRDAALDRALAWIEDPCRTGDSDLGLSTCLIASYGSAGISVASSVAAIVEGVALANVVLASTAQGDRRVRIGTLEFVERYAGTAEEAAHLIRDLDDRLPGALRESMTIVPDQCLRPGKGHRPAVRTMAYGAGQWHRIVVEAGPIDSDGRMRLQFVSFGSRARADQLEQHVDTVLLRRMLEDAVIRPTTDGKVNTALFEMLFPVDLKRELAGVENIQLVVDTATADFPWEALNDRGGLSGSGPVALRGGFLRQLATKPQRYLEPLSGNPRALVVGDPPGGPLFPRLDGARREAQEVATLLTASGQQVESVIFPADTPPELDSASRIVATLMGEDYRIVHIAGHGHFEPRPDKPPFGGVVIGPGAYLTAATLRSLRRPPDIVFLNCCHLGSVGATNIDDPGPDPPAFTRRKLPELAASLALELTLMGVRAVVVAGWAVADRPAEEFARTFYAEMLGGTSFGDAVTAARNAAYASDAGSSNTWAAYQCYGDPAVRLHSHSVRSAKSPSPVSADELQRRLEELEVDARDADEDYRKELCRRVDAEEERASKEWPRKSRMWSAFGMAYATLGQTEQAITSYRRALNHQDRLLPLKAVEELADLEHTRAVEVLRAGERGAKAFDMTPTQLMTLARKRLDSLDELGISQERHALRATLHEREAALYTDQDKEGRRNAALRAAVGEYEKAWTLGGGEPELRDPQWAVAARQLAALGAPEPNDAMSRSIQSLRRARTTADSTMQKIVAGLELAENLADIGEEKVRADVAAAYHRVFAGGSTIGEGDKLIARVEVLATLAAGPQRAALERLVDELKGWKNCC